MTDNKDIDQTERLALFIRDIIDSVFSKELLELQINNEIIRRFDEINDIIGEITYDENLKPNINLINIFIDEVASQDRFTKISYHKDLFQRFMESIQFVPNDEFDKIV